MCSADAGRLAINYESLFRYSVRLEVFDLLRRPTASSASIHFEVSPHLHPSTFSLRGRTPAHEVLRERVREREGDGVEEGGREKRKKITEREEGGGLHLPPYP